ncbi:MAG: prepilin-type N-terminal cleavage/methylation domain-containing protein [Patescibacteria group bacterium]
MGSQSIHHAVAAVRHRLFGRQGFTLLEVLLVVSIISVIAGFAIPVFQSFQVKNDLDIAANTIAASFRRAQTLATSSEGDSQWGVHIVTGSITLFQGTSFAARNAAYDEVFTVSATITPSGVGDVVFDRLTGEALSTGTVTLTASTGVVRTVAITSKGTVTY